MSRRDPHEGIPPFAVQYLVEVPAARRVLRWFHTWLRRTGRPIHQLEPAEINQFLTPLLTAKKPSTRGQHRRRLFRYFDWLRDRQLLSFDPRCLWPRSDFELPRLAVCFTKALEPTHKPATIGGYRTSLRQFHIWLGSQTLTVETVAREHVSSWLQWLHSRNHSAAHRVHAIQAVRAYFRWLEDRPDYVGKPADHLFRHGDLPKLPQYLPRPIPADLDRLLQRRLRKSRSTIQLGLLLMRRTGLRIGELRGLPFHCVHSDHLGRHFLKVPLGKLYNERLVPLDRVTMRLLEKLRVEGSTGRRGKRRTLLLQSTAGRPLPYSAYRIALERACRGLVFAEPMTSHRLRHTYATSMLVAGVSLPVLMKLLGHRDYRMTLRYAAITIETVSNEHADAVRQIEQRYNLPKPNAEPPSPVSALANLGRYLLKHVEDAGLDKRAARVLVRRLGRLDYAIQRLLRDCSHHPTRSD